MCHLSRPALAIGRRGAALTSQKKSAASAMAPQVSSWPVDESGASGILLAVTCTAVFAGACASVVAAR
jgi:hypothetical protein